jgi:hypothetical protein
MALSIYFETIESLANVFTKFKYFEQCTSIEIDIKSEIGIAN